MTAKPVAEDASQGNYIVGVMSMEVEAQRGGGGSGGGGGDAGEGAGRDGFVELVRAATRAFEERIAGALGVRVEMLAFRGPHLTPAGGAYAPLDFLRVGMTEKLERDVHFLLIVTEVDLAATALSYTLALPSQLTNVAVVSTKRLNPAFWGDEDDVDRATDHLTTLLLHSFGHLLNLPHDEDPHNVMYDFAGVDALAGMTQLTDPQQKRMRRTLPLEAHERTSRGQSTLGFILGTLFRDRGSIARAVWRANPFRLLTRLPTMITAALSVIIVVFFSPEPWDIASTVELYQLAIFSMLAIVAATAVLYRAFALGGAMVSRGGGGGAGGGGGGGGVGGRERVLAESTVVTAAATLLSLMLTMTLLSLIFMALTYLATLTIFPRKLMETWPTVDPAVRTLDHVKLSLFVAALSTLAGSLGGRADRRDLIRGVLFVDEET